MQQPWDPREAAILYAVFALVENKEHWKGPIDKTLAVPSIFRDELIALIRKSVGEYTGEAPQITIISKEVFKVRARGYWAVCGA